MRIKTLLLVLILFTAPLYARWSDISNGVLWYDTAGAGVQAHGAGFLKQGDTWYMVGEDRTGGVSVNLYASTDLVHWRFLHKIITAATCPQLADGSRFIERPKLLYNARTKRYVVWLHYEGESYAPAEAGVFTCDSIDSDYTFVRGSRPLGNMSRDCGTFIDDDGTAYFFSSSNNNADMMVYRLTDDYLNIQKLVNKLFVGAFREAPAMFKRGGMYYLLTSACTGWEPNQGCYSTAKTIDGTWSALRPLGDRLTYDTQPTYVLPIAGTRTTTYIYVGDRWMDPGLPESKTILFPLEFAPDGSLTMANHKQWRIDLSTGVWEAR